MADNSSGSRDRKLGLIAPFSIVAAIAFVVVAAALFATRSAKEPPRPPPTVAAPPASPAPRPVPETTWGRTELVASANALAAAYAANGAGAAGTKDSLAGRKFTLRIPFGCEGPQVRPGGSQAYYEFDSEKRTVRLMARPAIWTTLPVVHETVAPDRLEAVEGFWIPQPWTASERCPPPRETPVPASPTPPAAETLGLARLFEPGASRIGRRAERAYEHVVKLDDGEPLPLAQGYRLVIEGRLAAFPDGRVAHCWSESAAHRPVCLYAVEFDRVAFETGDEGRLLAEWRD
ncbi:hypothetical protein [Phenylobacterium sp.]|uniref:hypothetical protein n=1 Tax=Phenylobacterium sp. TaxID=1871053 RepID=UPI002EDB4200